MYVGAMIKFRAMENWFAKMFTLSDCLIRIYPIDQK